MGSMLPMEWQNVVYFYWFGNKPAGDDSEEAKADIMASMLDEERGLVSTIFTMAQKRKKA